MKYFLDTHSVMKHELNWKDSEHSVEMYFMRLIREWNLAETEVSDRKVYCGEFPSVSQHKSSSIETSQKIC